MAELGKDWNLYRGNWEVTCDLPEVHFKAVLEAGGAQVQWVKVWLQSDYSESEYKPLFWKKLNYTGKERMDTTQGRTWEDDFLSCCVHLLKEDTAARERLKFLSSKSVTEGKGMGRWGGLWEEMKTKCSGGEFSPIRKEAKHAMSSGQVDKQEKV